ncbi:unnamed protein product [Cuscuta europaea]|uniref:Uncharacterized protein n=1 Tax=Cuscuta europaea TaxID=41803 RepID=A0A9P1E4Q7_CUSEU|nr:unnamed protein product [Cuscuta europaea]
MCHRGDFMRGNETRGESIYGVKVCRRKLHSESRRRRHPLYGEFRAKHKLIQSHLQVYWDLKCRIARIYFIISFSCKCILENEIGCTLLYIVYLYLYFIIMKMKKKTNVNIYSLDSIICCFSFLFLFVALCCFLLHHVSSCFYYIVSS